MTTSINGSQVASFDASDVPGGGLSAGTVGFREDTPEAADFKNLTVTDPTGATLFSSPLDQESDLNAFDFPGTSGASVDYNTFDVTRLLHPGTDAIAVSLGNGFYAGGADDYGTTGEPWQPNQPKLKLELKVWYKDGRSTTIVSDGSWKVTTGPTTSNSPAVESFDARLEKPGWMKAGYDDSSWDDAAVLPAPDAVLRAETIPPVKKTATIDPVKVTDAGRQPARPLTHRDAHAGLDLEHHRRTQLPYPPATSSCARRSRSRIRPRFRVRCFASTGMTAISRT